MVRSHNVWFKNPQWTELIDQIALGAWEHDFLCLQEATDEMLKTLTSKLVGSDHVLLYGGASGSKVAAGLIYKKTRFDLVADPYYGCFKLLPKKDKKATPEPAAEAAAADPEPATAEPALAEAAAEADKVEDESLNPFESKSKPPLEPAEAAASDPEPATAEPAAAEEPEAAEPAAEAAAADPEPATAEPAAAEEPEAAAAPPPAPRALYPPAPELPAASADAPKTPGRGAKDDGFDRGRPILSAVFFDRLLQRYTVMLSIHCPHGGSKPYSFLSNIEFAALQAFKATKLDPFAIDHIVMAGDCNRDDWKKQRQVGLNGILFKLTSAQGHDAQGAPGAMQPTLVTTSPKHVGAVDNVLWGSRTPERTLELESFVVEADALGSDHRPVEAKFTERDTSFDI